MTHTHPAPRTRRTRLEGYALIVRAFRARPTWGACGDCGYPHIETNTNVECNRDEIIGSVVENAVYCDPCNDQTSIAALGDLVDGKDALWNMGRTLLDHAAEYAELLSRWEWEGGYDPGYTAPPACGHSACRQHWIDEGDPRCVVDDDVVGVCPVAGCDQWMRRSNAGDCLHGHRASGLAQATWYDTLAPAVRDVVGNAALCPAGERLDLVKRWGLPSAIGEPDPYDVISVLGPDAGMLFIDEATGEPRAYVCQAERERARRLGVAR